MPLAFLPGLLVALASAEPVPQLRGTFAQNESAVKSPPQFIQDLNKAIHVSSGWTSDPATTPYEAVYGDGDNTGVFFFNYFDGFQPPLFSQGGGSLQTYDTLLSVRVGTFWHNDIFTPSQAYPPVGDINVKLDPAAPDPNDDAHAFDFAVVGPVVGPAGMAKQYGDFGNIQKTDWGSDWAFYSHDSNAGDHRCHYLEDQKAWECPGWWCPEDQACVQAPTKRGAAADYGYGQGCHFRDAGFFDQTDAYDTTQQQNLVQDKQCQCNYRVGKTGHADSWKAWVEQWRNGATHKGHEDTLKDYFWFKNELSPQWGADYAACWMNNPRDMILLQNQLWWNRAEWLGQRPPVNVQDPASISYWGWNEIVLEPDVVNNPSNWDAVAIKLPAGKTSLSDLKGDIKTNLESQLSAYIADGKLLTGKENAANRPGSSVAVVKEYMDQSKNWQKEFFCEKWKGKCFEVVYDKAAGGCYLRCRLRCRLTKKC